jgi:hypothetical protein
MANERVQRDGQDAGEGEGLSSWLTASPSFMAKLRFGHQAGSRTKMPGEGERL